MKKMLDHGARRLILLLLIVSMLAAACPSMAETSKDMHCPMAMPMGKPQTTRKMSFRFMCFPPYIPRMVLILDT